MRTNNYCVYCHICPNEKRYYGMSKNLKIRWRSNGCEYKDNAEFYNAIVEFGWDNIEHIIIKDNLTKEKAKLLEEELIKTYRTYDSTYGYNKYIGNRHTEEQRIAHGETIKGINNYMYGKHHTDEAKAKISETHKGDNNINAKSIICITTNMIFNTMTEGANYYGVCHSGISNCCRGKQNYCGKLSDGTKLIWEYIDIITL